MNSQDILRYVDSLHREKNIDKSVVIEAIESAMQTAAKRQFGEESDVEVRLDPQTAQISATRDGQPLSEEQISRIGRIGAQSAKQVIIQKVKEAERDTLMTEYRDQIGEMVSGIIGKVDGGVATVNLGNVEAILPRSEQIPGEQLHAGERVRAVVFEVKAQGNRVRVVLSRTRPQLVQRLFEQEIPELGEEIISIRSISREPGYRSKVAVSTVDSGVDPIAVCVGYRGSRIKAVREELAGEHIDVVNFSDDPEELIPNALQPAAVEQVLLCDMIGRAIVLVQEDQLSLAIGRRGQNVRLASKLCGWDIEIMTSPELEEQIERAVMGFSQIEGITEELAQALVEQGYLSYDDLSVIEPDVLMELGGLSEEAVDRIVNTAEEMAEAAEEAAAEERRIRREREQAERDAAEMASKMAPSDRPAAAEASAAEGTEAAGTEASDTEASDAVVATEPPAEVAPNPEDGPADPAPLAEAVEAADADADAGASEVSEVADSAEAGSDETDSVEAVETAEVADPSATSPNSQS